MHISSLPGKYGIGDFGSSAYRFVDFLHRAKQGNWQILPLGVTGYGDSPYQCFSSFAGNPYFIDLDELVSLGYLDKEELAAVNFGSSLYQIDYQVLHKNKHKYLRLAYENAREQLARELEDFYQKNIDWLREFALFMSLKKYNDYKAWYDWPKKYLYYHSKDVANFEEENKEEVFFWIFTQYFFTRQWKKLKSYANSKNIEIIGDLPIYTSVDSSDLWKNPQLFKLDKDFKATKLAGVPPDAFTSKGQLWGNPIYKWDAMEEEGYSWWLRRIDYNLKMVDILRIDHFRGFESFWEVDYGALDARDGQWRKGPGIKLFQKIKEELGQVNIIVEDLGINTEAVEELVIATGFPNMKVLQFAFNPWEESHHLPHRVRENSVVYTGTHDNPTVIDWLCRAEKEEIEYVKDYLKLDPVEGYNWGVIRAAWATSAHLAIAPIQDFLALGKEARMNTPGTSRGNWTWRLEEDLLTDQVAERIAKLTWTYRR